MRWGTGGRDDEESTIALTSGKHFHYCITSKKNQRSLCRSRKLTEDNGENNDEFQKTPFSLLTPVKKRRVTSHAYWTKVQYTGFQLLDRKISLNASDDYNKTIDEKIAAIK